MKKAWILALIGAMLLTLAACGKTEEPADTTVASELEGVAVVYYHGDRRASELVREEGRIPKLTAQNLVNLLIEEKVLPEGVRVRNFQVAQKLISLDLTGEMEEAAGKLGTSGEYILLGSLVNTFLSNYDAEQLELTIEGRKLATGHEIYDEPLGFYE